MMPPGDGPVPPPGDEPRPGHGEPPVAGSPPGRGFGQRPAIGKRSPLAGMIPAGGVRIDLAPPGSDQPPEPPPSRDELVRRIPVFVRPGVVAALSVCAGVAAADGLGAASMPGSGLLLAAALLCAVIAAFVPALAGGGRTGRGIAISMLALACAGLGAARTTAVLYERTRDDLATVLAASAPAPVASSPAARNRPPSVVLTVSGIVESVELASADPRPSPFANDSASGFRPVDHGTAVLRVRELAGRPVTGRLRLALPPDVVLSVGANVSVTGQFLAPSEPGAPGQRQAERIATASGMAGTLLCRDGSLVRSLDPPGPVAAAEGRTRAMIDSLRSTTRGLLGLSATPPSAGSGSASPPQRAEVDALIAALLLGEYQPAIRETSDRFARLGLLHALSISGFHIAVIAAVVGVLLRLAGLLGRANRIALVMVVVLYMLMLPAAAPITRSGLTMAAGALVLTLGRSYDPLNILGFIAAGLALWNPVDVFTPGFPLTFIATGALLRFTGPIAGVATGLVARLIQPESERLRGALATGWSWRPLAGALLRAVLAAVGVGLVIWCVTAPTIVAASGWLSLLGIFISLALAPLISGVLVLSLLGILAGLAATLVGADAASMLWLMAPARWLAGITLWLSTQADAVPGVAVLLPPLGATLGPIWAVATTAMVWFALEARLVLGWRGGFGRLLRTGGVVALLLILAVTLYRGDTAASGPGTVDQISVGSGTATLVRGVPQGAPAGTMLIDPGSRGPNGAAAAAAALRRALRELGSGSTPDVLITGATVQHAGALPELVESMGVRRVMLAHGLSRLVATGPDRPISKLVAGLRARGISIVELAPGTVLQYGTNAVRLGANRDGTDRYEILGMSPPPGGD